MSIFGGLSTPKYLSPEESWANTGQLAPLVSQNFAQGFQNAQQRSDQQEALNRQLQAAQVTAAKQAQAAEWLHGNGTDGDTTRPWEAVSQHPELLLDPATAKGTAEILKASVAASKAKSGSLETKIALQQTSDFTKQLDTLNGDDPESVAAIRGMSKAKDGSPSANQWNALSLAQERIQLNHKQTMAQAEIDARARGDNVTVTTGPKGETITAKTPPPAKSAADSADPQLKTYEGQHFVYVPKTGKLQKLAESGETKSLTPAELTKIATSPNVDDGLKTMATENLKRLGKPVPSNGLPPPPKIEQVVKGYKFKGGDPSQKSNWEKVNE